MELLRHLYSKARHEIIRAYRTRKSFRDRLKAVELARDSPNKVLVACSRLVYPIRYSIPFLIPGRYTLRISLPEGS